MMRRVFVALTLTVLLGGGYWLFWESPWLTVKKTTVMVTAPIAATVSWRDPGLVDRVRRALPDMGGMHLVSVNTADVSVRAQDVRGVARVEVRRGWPDALVVVITPAQPVAYVKRTSLAGTVTQSSTPSSQPAPSTPPTPARVVYGLIDARGVIVDERRTPPRTFPLLAGKVHTVGGRAALDVLMDLPPWLRTKVVTIKSQKQSSADTVEFTLRSGRIIVWGAPENGARKAQVLKKMVAFDGRIIDVSAPEVPVTKK